MTTETNRLRAALAQPENRPCTCHPDDNPPQPCAQRYALTECKALAQPETEAEPMAWAVACDGSAVEARLTETAANLIAQNLREKNRARGFDWRVRPLYLHPPRDEWRPASEPPEDGRQVLGWQKRGYWDAVHFLNGNWFVEATGRHTLTITHWRDVQPPTEGA